MRNWATILLAALCFTGVAHGQGNGWTYLGADAQNSAWYYVNDDIRRNGSSVWLWVRLDHSQNRLTRARQTTYLITLDCEMGTVRTLQSSSILPDGQVYNKGGPGASSYIEPDTMIKLLQKEFC